MLLRKIAVQKIDLPLEAGFTNMDAQINPVYLSAEVMQQMKAAFSQQRVLRLDNFFTVETHKHLRSLGKKKGKEVYVPHQYRYMALPSAAEIAASCSSFIEKITGKRMKTRQMSVRSFGHRDFTLLHDDVESKKRLVFFYTIADLWDVEAGGQHVFTHNDESTPLVFAPQDNSLVIMEVPEGMRDFVKYVNHKAGKDRLLIFEGVF